MLVIADHKTGAFSLVARHAETHRVTTSDVQIDVINIDWEYRTRIETLYKG